MACWAVSKASLKGLMYRIEAQAIILSCSYLTNLKVLGDFPEKDYLPSGKSNVLVMSSGN